ncbi:GM19453 [Drosophila sechellia]|uniref:GM19453 n=1 Tax=Drosophila sechellia TaxID=7238 RepID=B4IGM5_DROSE|nr:GM19453 [Drosophila sechellia]
MLLLLLTHFKPTSRQMQLLTIAPAQSFPIAAALFGAVWASEPDRTINCGRWQSENNGKQLLQCQRLRSRRKVTVEQAIKNGFTRRKRHTKR